MEPQIIVGQILGIIATLIFVISYQANTKNKVLFLQVLAVICICVSYLLLGAISGFVLNIICLIRNICFLLIKKEGKVKWILTFALILGMIGGGILSWQGPISLLFLVALSINTFFLSLGVPQKLRYSILVTSPMALIYNIAVFSIGGIANELLSIISSVIGILRFRKTEKDIKILQQ